MKREIRFRAPSMDGKWTYGSLITNEHPTFENSTQIYNVNGFTIVDPETVGQFTGIVVDGEDLYENDIITWEEQDVINKSNGIYTKRMTLDEAIELYPMTTQQIEQLQKIKK